MAGVDDRRLRLVACGVCLAAGVALASQSRPSTGAPLLIVNLQFTTGCFVIKTEVIVVNNDNNNNNRGEICGGHVLSIFRIFSAYFFFWRKSTCFAMFCAYLVHPKVFRIFHRIFHQFPHISAYLPHLTGLSGLLNFFQPFRPFVFILGPIFIHLWAILG